MEANSEFRRETPFVKDPKISVDWTTGGLVALVTQENGVRKRFLMTPKTANTIGRLLLRASQMSFQGTLADFDRRAKQMIGDEPW